MKIVPLSRYLYPIIPFFLLGQSIDTTIVKYFPTDLTRSILLKDGVDSSKLRKRAYFKATYDGGGDLIKVEYVPASRDRGLPVDTAGENDGHEDIYGPGLHGRALGVACGYCPDQGIVLH